jgi:hypothetical protein
VTADHLEPDPTAGLRLGLRPPSNAPAIRFGAVLKQIPAHPLVVNHTSVVKPWRVLGNDVYSNCGPVSIANSRALVTKTLGGRLVYPTLKQTLDLYRRSGNPAFPIDDNGVILQTMLGEVVKGGIGGKKALAFAKVDVHDLEQVKAAIAIFGYVVLGANLQRAQATQTVWDLANSPTWGGHAVLAANYATGQRADVGIVSWGKVLAMTDAYWSARVRECWAVIWPENVGTRQFVEGIDAGKLAENYQTLTGRTLTLPAKAGGL